MNSYVVAWPLILHQLQGVKNKFYYNTLIFEKVQNIKTILN